MHIGVTIFLMAAHAGVFAHDLEKEIENAYKACHDFQIFVEQVERSLAERTLHTFGDLEDKSVLSDAQLDELVQYRISSADEIIGGSSRVSESVKGLCARSITEVITHFAEKAEPLMDLVMLQQVCVSPEKMRKDLDEKKQLLKDWVATIKYERAQESHEEMPTQSGQ
jgi:hypothetical protein